MLNRQVVDYALRLGEAMHFDVPPESIFHRKNYFYPDMPKDYQVSQYDAPICVDGWMEIDGTRIRIERAHMEEDTGKTQHIGGGGRIHDATHSLVDYNRAGVPLMEIVSQPDIRSAEQARAYVSELRGVLQAIGVSDVKMEEGSMRVDANVSIRPVGTEALGTKVEVKNMNSLRSLGRAIDYEIERQIAAMESGERIVQETRGWDEAAGVSEGMRSKEGSNDYRYFPEPDLVPVAPSDEMRADAARRGARAAGRRAGRGFVAEWGVADQDARVLVDNPLLADYADAAVAVGCAGQGRGELVHRRDPRLPQRDRALARGAAAPAGRAGRAHRARAGRHAVAQPGQGRARRVPARAEAAEAGGGGARARPGERRGRAGDGPRRGARGERRTRSPSTGRVTRRCGGRSAASSSARS